jgi:TetR/AcrR family transcriptional regulator
VVTDVKEAMLKAARKHFALHGYQGASLKDIAAEAGVANSLINYHFTDKQGLFKACTELFAHGRMQAINRLLAEPKSREDFRVRLELFVEEMFESIISDPFGFDIIDREIQARNPMIIKLFEETMLKAFKNVVQFFQVAQQNGLIKPELDPLIVASLLFTSTCDSGRKDFMAQTFFNISFSDPVWRKKFTTHVVNLFLEGVMK